MIPEYKVILAGCFTYYQRLGWKDQLLFEKRVQKFIDKKVFIPEEPLEFITSEMKVLIAASAIQLTFGLPGVYFKRFRFIHIHPDFFLSEAMLQFNAGEVHKNGHIHLSWKHFLAGYLVPADGRNLGLHEMAHVLRLENMIKNEEYSYFKWKDIEVFNQITVEESEKIINGGNSLLRDYATVHYHEFFAVVVEVFFEQPEQLKAYHPELYHVTARLLRQDLLNQLRRQVT